ncbi:MAG TPA: hypothetical protein DEA47_06160 [Peptococcaceae bacterium]|nr:hypothetical protein [Peptococcaceae bacterium]
MIKLKNQIKNFFNYIKNIKYAKAFLILAILLIFSTVGIYFFEHETNRQFNSIFDGLWWSLVTISTVGYGDKYPTTPGGKIVGFILMFGGIGTFGYLAGLIIKNAIDRQRGKISLNLTDHYIICNYNRKARNIAEEIHAEEKNAKIVLVCCHPENPLEDLNIYFINGDCADEEALKKANVEKAKSVIVLASEIYEEPISDSHSVLTTLAVRHLNPSVKITAEVLDANNESHLRRAGADEVVVSDLLISRFLARSNFYDKGYNFLNDLIRTDSGINIFDAPAKDDTAGKTYGELYNYIKSRGGILLALYKDSKILPLPDENILISEDDHLIYISRQKILQPLLIQVNNFSIFHKLFSIHNNSGLQYYPIQMAGHTDLSSKSAVVPKGYVHRTQNLLIFENKTSDLRTGIKTYAKLRNII